MTRPPMRLLLTRTCKSGRKAAEDPLDRGRIETTFLAGNRESRSGWVNSSKASAFKKVFFSPQNKQRWLMDVPLGRNTLSGLSQSLNLPGQSMLLHKTAHILMSSGLNRRFKRFYAHLQTVRAIGAFVRLQYLYRRRRLIRNCP